MKFGIHAGLWMDRWTQDPAPLFDRAAALGFDAVELSLLGIGPEQAARLRQAAADAGVALSCSTGLGPEADPASADPEVRPHARETLARAIETVAALGSSRLAGVVAAPWGQFDPAHKSDRAKRSGETLGQMQAHLAQHGVTLGIEALNRFESDLTSTAAEACAIARAAGAANVGVLLDSFHMNIEEKDPPAALRAAGDTLVHYHVSDNDRGVPGSGRYDFAADARALKDIGYQGWIVAEMFVRAGRPTSADLNIWRDIEPDADQAAAQALAHMKEEFADVG